MTPKQLNLVGIIFICKGTLDSTQIGRCSGDIWEIAIVHYIKSLWYLRPKILHKASVILCFSFQIYLYNLNQQFWQLNLIVRSTQENWSVIWCCWPQLLRQFFIVFFPELFNLYEDNRQFLRHWRVEYLIIIACYFNVFLQDWAKTLK